ncbi:ATP synthase F1 subcomplex delta subunit [Fodinibius roseus]|uniref:ATP synthase subunit delta n=1 Tax=Fodinibius roseus TaxID=1194090 RepID=A0A1M4T6Y8_9BACT|nr:ATP synthase F1 subunit delta [Fodinibius roseus]SHE40098.1 ATP synthase F1 subcomplex delta subunit [Fodinibius roseus]
MHSTKAARRYATALLEVAKERNELDEILDDITLIRNTMEDSKELGTFLKSPIIKFDDKVAVLDELFFDNLQEATRLFIKLLARKDRINLLEDVVNAFVAKYKEHAGIITIDVFVAEELNEEQRESLHRTLEKKTQKNVDLNLTLDESLKGGMAVRIDDTVIDGTVKHQLAKLEESLLSTAVE